jgi:hypothetical protein
MKERSDFGEPLKKFLLHCDMASVLVSFCRHSHERSAWVTNQMPSCEMWKAEGDRASATFVISVSKWS